MSKERKKTCLREIANIVMGISPSSSSCNLNSEGFPLLNGPSEFGSHHPKAVQFTNNPKKFSKKGDLLFCVRGSTGKMNWSDQEYAIGRGLAAIQSKNGQLFSSFIKGCIEKELKNLLASSTGSVFSSVNRTQLEEIPVYLPSNEEINKIENLLGSLEKKIEVNRKNHEILEEIAKALFKSWFIDFDPVKAKSEGRATGLPDEISNLFPDSFEDSEIGAIPSTWRNTSISKLIEINPTRKISKDTVAPFLEMKGVPTSGHTATGVYDRGFTSGTKFQQGDTLLARITPCLENGKTAMVDFLDERQIGWGSTEFIVLCGKEKIHNPFVYYLSRSEIFREHAIRNMVGSSGRQRVPYDSLYDFNIANPPIILINLFSEIASSFLQKITTGSQEIISLEKIRNTLLPKLISGEIRIPDAEVILEEVANL